MILQRANGPLRLRRWLIPSISWWLIQLIKLVGLMLVVLQLALASGSVVVSLQLADQRRRFRWPTEPDHSLAVSTTAWTGLEVGHGYLQERRMSVAATGRRGAVRERRVEVCIDAQGTLVAAAPERDATVRHLSRVS